MSGMVEVEELVHQDRSTMDSALGPDFQSTLQLRVHPLHLWSLFRFHQYTMSVQSPGAFERRVQICLSLQYWVVFQADLFDC